MGCFSRDCEADELHRQMARMDLALRDIRDAAFTSMEGAGMPEFRNYEYIYKRACEVLEE